MLQILRSVIGLGFSWCYWHLLLMLSVCRGAVSRDLSRLGLLVLLGHFHLCKLRTPQLSSVRLREGLGTFVAEIEDLAAAAAVRLAVGSFEYSAVHASLLAVVQTVEE
jgi:hypothetical protein